MLKPLGEIKFKSFEKHKNFRFEKFFFLNGEKLNLVAILLIRFIVAISKFNLSKSEERIDQKNLLKSVHKLCNYFKS